MVLDGVEETHADACAVEKVWVWGYRGCFLLTSQRALAIVLVLILLCITTECCSC